MRSPPPLPAAAICAFALWQAAQATPLAAMPAPGLWWLFARLGVGDAFAHLLPVAAAGGIAVALTQPLAHVRHARPWAEGIAAALLLAGLLLPVPVAVLAAALPFAPIAKAGRWIGIAVAASLAVPIVGPVALGIAAWRLLARLRLPSAANDNQIMFVIAR